MCADDWLWHCVHGHFDFWRVVVVPTYNPGDWALPRLTSHMNVCDRARSTSSSCLVGLPGTCLRWPAHSNIDNARHLLAPPYVHNGDYFTSIFPFTTTATNNQRRYLPLQFDLCTAFCQQMLYATPVSSHHTATAGFESPLQRTPFTVNIDLFTSPRHSFQHNNYHQLLRKRITYP